MWTYVDATLTQYKAIGVLWVTRWSLWGHWGHMNLVRGGTHGGTYEKGAQWLVTLCASVVHEWDKCATILAFEVYLVWDFWGHPRDFFGAIFGPFLAIFGSFLGHFCAIF